MKKYIPVFMLLFFAVYTLFVEYIVISRFPSDDPISILVYLYFLFPSTFILVCVYKFCRRFSSQQ